jgi:hypothetical protein
MAPLCVLVAVSGCNVVLGELAGKPGSIYGNGVQTSRYRIKFKAQLLKIAWSVCGSPVFQVTVAYASSSGQDQQSLLSHQVPETR